MFLQSLVSVSTLAFFSVASASDLAIHPAALLQPDKSHKRQTGTEPYWKQFCENFYIDPSGKTYTLTNTFAAAIRGGCRGDRTGSEYYLWCDYAVNPTSNIHCYYGEDGALTDKSYCRATFKPVSELCPPRVYTLEGRCSALRTHANGYCKFMSSVADKVEDSHLCLLGPSKLADAAADLLGKGLDILRNEATRAPPMSEVKKFEKIFFTVVATSVGVTVAVLGAPTFGAAATLFGLYEGACGIYSALGTIGKTCETAFDYFDTVSSCRAPPKEMRSLPPAPLQAFEVVPRQHARQVTGANPCNDILQYLPSESVCAVATDLPDCSATLADYMRVGIPQASAQVLISNCAAISRLVNLCNLHVEMSLHQLIMLIILAGRVFVEAIPFCNADGSVIPGPTPGSNNTSTSTPSIPSRPSGNISLSTPPTLSTAAGTTSLATLPPQPLSNSVTTTTYTITSCPASITDCPLGRVVTTVLTVPCSKGCSLTGNPVPVPTCANPPCVGVTAQGTGASSTKSAATSTVVQASASQTRSSLIGMCITMALGSMLVAAGTALSHV